MVAFPPCWEVVGANAVLDYRNQGVQQTAIGEVIDGPGGDLRVKTTIGSKQVPLDLLQEVSVHVSFWFYFSVASLCQEGASLPGEHPPYHEGKPPHNLSLIHI